MAKVCNKCHLSKPLSMFHKHPRAKDGRFNICKVCSHENLKEIRNKPENRERFKSYRRRCELRKRYGIDDEDYARLLIRQKFRCAICGKYKATETGNQIRLHVDHCHMTKSVRGLLCSFCNRGLAFFMDNPRLLRSAASYLERHNAKAEKS